MVFPEFCSPFEQDCPEGYKCNPFSNGGSGTWNDLQCVPVDPMPDGFGEPCTVQEYPTSGVDSCDVGALCIVDDVEALTGECIELCGGSPEEPTCEQPEAQCVISAEGSIAPCRLPCDPLGEECDADEVCVPTHQFFTCLPDASEEGGAFGDSCKWTNGCNEGLGCFAPLEGICADGAPGCCLPYCSLAAPDCPDMLTCLPFWEDDGAPEGYEDVGLCHLPPE